MCCSYLATGDVQQTISFSYRLGVTTVHNIVKETCKAIWEIVGPKFLAVPNTHCEWTAIADEFYRMWNFPNCISAVDGKHIVIQAYRHVQDPIFTALHGMQTRSSDENSVRLSVCPSIRHTREL